MQNFCGTQSHCLFVLNLPMAVPPSKHPFLRSNSPQDLSTPLFTTEPSLPPARRIRKNYIAHTHEVASSAAEPGIRYLQSILKTKQGQPAHSREASPKK